MVASGGSANPMCYLLARKSKRCIRFWIFVDVYESVILPHFCTPALSIPKLCFESRKEHDSNGLNYLFRGVRDPESFISESGKDFTASRALKGPTVPNRVKWGPRALEGSIGPCRAP